MVTLGSEPCLSNVAIIHSMRIPLPSASMSWEKLWSCRRTGRTQHSVRIRVASHSVPWRPALYRGVFTSKCMLGQVGAGLGRACPRAEEWMQSELEELTLLTMVVNKIVATTTSWWFWFDGAVRNDDDGGGGGCGHIYITASIIQRHWFWISWDDERGKSFWLSIIFLVTACAGYRFVTRKSGRSR